MKRARKGRRSGAGAADDADYLASVSDLMSGLLFVFMIALMVFALSFVFQEHLKKQELERLQGSDLAREELLRSIEERLRTRGVEVRVDARQGVLRLREGILFDSGSALLGEAGTAVVSVLAGVLAETLPCYTVEAMSPLERDCPSRSDSALLDALLIEGHTDDRPIVARNQFEDNWELSTARARTVYLKLLEQRGGLDLLRNRDSQSILSVSGYADRRPVAENTSDDNRRQNRRIDLRFILSPRREERVPKVAREVERGVATGLGAQ